MELLASDLVVYLLPLALAGLGWLGRKLLKDRSYSSFFYRLGAYAEMAVEATHNEYVKAIKEGRADGKLTDEEKAEAKRRAVAKIKSYASLGKLFGESQEAMAADAIEAKINDSNRSESLPPR